MPAKANMARMTPRPRASKDTEAVHARFSGRTSVDPSATKSNSAPNFKAAVPVARRTPLATPRRFTTVSTP